jgi:hypothetical protein
LSSRGKNYGTNKGNERSKKEGILIECGIYSKEAIDYDGFLFLYQ